MPFQNLNAPTAAPTPLRLRGPTGIRVGKGWVKAYVVGVPIAGLTYGEADKYDDGGRRWLLSAVRQKWSPSLAEAIDAGGIKVDE